MKKLVFTGLAALMMLAGLNSCNDTKAEFGINSYSITEYVKVVDDQYFFCTGFMTQNGTVESARISHDGLGLSYSRMHTDTKIFEAYETGYSLSSLNGTYRLEATSSEGEESWASRTLNLSTDDVPGDIVYENFYYDGQQFKMTIPNTIENTQYYGFFIDMEPEYAYLYYTSYGGNTVVKMKDQVVTAQFSTNDILEGMVARVYPITWNYTSDYVNVLKYSATDYKTLRRGATSFDEDGE